MAENDAERTEAPTGRRVGQAVNEGNVALSRDAAQWVGLCAGTIALTTFAGRMRESLLALVVTSTRLMGDRRATFEGLLPFVSAPLRLAFTVGAASAITAAVAMLVQTGGRMWPNLIFKGFDKLISFGALKRLWSPEVAFELGMALVKVMTVGWAAYSGLRGEFLTLPSLLTASAGAQLSLLLKPLSASAVKVLTAMGIIAGLDVALVRFRYQRNLRMSKEEVKREHREDEGDPAIKSKRRRKQRELARNRARKEVPRADALVVNPTHIAVAIRYRPGDGDRAPVVVAKGKGVLAEFMRELARDNSVPIYQDIPLARMLYKRVKVGRAVPSDTYRAVAAVLAFVYRVTGRKPVAARAVAPARTARPGAHP